MKLAPKIILLLLLNSWLTMTWAQPDKELIPEDYKLQLKWNATALLTPNFPGLQLGAEHIVGNRTTLIHELGAFRRFPLSISNNRFVGINGFRARTGIRRYANGPHKNYTNFYLSLWLQYKREHRSGERFVERFGGAYRELIELEENWHYLGGFCTVGWQGAMSPNSRWEVDLGLGVRQRWIQRSEDLENNTNFSALTPNGEILFPNLFPAMTLDFRFNFLLK